MDVVFGLIATTMLAGYGVLLWEGTAPERALGFVVVGGLLVGLLAKIANGVLASGGCREPVDAPVGDNPDGTPLSSPDGEAGSVNRPSPEGHV